jgi:hypothetical protein
LSTNRRCNCRNNWSSKCSIQIDENFSTPFLPKDIITLNIGIFDILEMSCFSTSNPQFKVPAFTTGLKRSHFGAKIDKLDVLNH